MTIPTWIPRLGPRLLAIAALALLVLPPSVQSQGVPEAVIGVLYANDPGQSMSTRAAAANVGAQVVNTYLQAAGDPTRVRLVLAETGQDPARAAAAAQAMYAQGIRVIVGPETSGEVQAILQLPVANQMVLVSYGSTAPSLNSPTVPLFRLAPNDNLQADAMSLLLRDDRVQTIVPIWRADVFGRDLVGAMRTRFAALGGNVTEGISYPPATTDWAPIAAQLADQVRQAQRSGGTVAVYAVTFAEISGLMRAANAVSPLGDVPWYGSDGAVLDRGILEEGDTAAFALRTGFVAPLYDEFQEPEQAAIVAQAIRQATGLAPEPYAMTAYDSVVLAGIAAARGGAVDATRFAAAFRAEAPTYLGVTGRILLDERGDRIAGDYNFWALSARSGELYWVEVASYELEPGQPPIIERARTGQRPIAPGVLPLLPVLPSP